MHVLSCILAISLVVSTTNLFAQQSPIQSGARVRVTAPDCGLDGRATTVEGLRGDTLMLDTSDCPVSSVTGLAVSRDRQAHPLRDVGVVAKHTKAAKQPKVHPTPAKSFLLIDLTRA